MNIFSFSNSNISKTSSSLFTYQQSSSIKRQNLHNKIRSQQYQKLRKTSRQQIILRQQQLQYKQFIKQTSILPLTQFQPRIKQILPNCDIMQIIITLTHFKYSLNFQQQYTIQLFSKLLQLVENKIFKFQSISLIDLMIKTNKNIAVQIVEETKIVDKIVENILSINKCDIQSFYIIGLDNLIRSYQKNSNNKSFKYYQLILSIINNKQTNYIDQLMLLSTISTYITPTNPLPQYLICRVLQTFQSTLNINTNNIINSNQSSIQQHQVKLVLINTFLILNKVVYYNQKINLRDSYKMMKMFLYDKKCLSQNIVENYHNIWIIIGILIKKIDVYELKYLQKQQKDQFILQNISQYSQQQQQDFKLPLTFTSHSIITIIMNHILTVYPFILSLQQFSTPYLIFLSYLTQFCSPSILTPHFIHHQIFLFLQQCIDHHDKQIIIIALEILINMFKQGQSERIEIVEYVKNATKIKEIIQEKYHYEKNKIILKKVQVLIEKMHQYKD